MEAGAVVPPARRTSAPVKLSSTGLVQARATVVRVTEVATSPVTPTRVVCRVTVATGPKFAAPSCANSA